MLRRHARRPSSPAGYVGYWLVWFVIAVGVSLPVRLAVEELGVSSEFLQTALSMGFGFLIAGWLWPPGIYGSWADRSTDEAHSAESR